MRKIEAVISIDKLALCYIATGELIEKLSEKDENDVLVDEYDYDCFRLQRVPSEEAIYVNFFNVLIKFPKENGKSGCIERKFATLKTKPRSMEEGKKNYIWLYIENWVFYEVFLTIQRSKCNWLSCVDYIVDELGLIFNNITSMDIALDGNVNIAKRIKHAQFDDAYTVKLNGTFRRNKEEVLDNILHISTGDQIKLRTTTIVAKPQKKKDEKLSLKVYNKTNELEKSSKRYISKWVDINSTIYRTEITIGNENLKEFYAHKGECIPYELLLTTFANQSESQLILFEMMKYFSNRLLMFNYNPEHKGKGETLSIFEL